MSTDLTFEEKLELVMRFANTWQSPGHHAKVVLKCTGVTGSPRFEAEINSTSSGTFKTIVAAAPSLPALIDELLSKTAAHVSATIGQRRSEENQARIFREELEAHILGIEADIVQRKKT